MFVVLDLMATSVLVKNNYICSAVIVNKEVTTLFAFQSGIAKKATACDIVVNDAQQLRQTN